MSFMLPAISCFCFGCVSCFMDVVYVVFNLDVRLCYGSDTSFISFRINKVGFLFYMMVLEGFAFVFSLCVLLW
jgi:hypothetical protein